MNAIGAACLSQSASLFLKKSIAPNPSCPSGYLNVNVTALQVHKGILGIIGASNGSIATNDADKAQILANHFETVFTRESTLLEVVPQS